MKIELAPWAPVAAIPLLSSFPHCLQIRSQPWQAGRASAESAKPRDSLPAPPAEGTKPILQPWPPLPSWCSPSAQDLGAGAEPLSSRWSDCAEPWQQRLSRRYFFSHGRQGERLKPDVHRCVHRSGFIHGCSHPVSNVLSTSPQHRWKRLRGWPSPSWGLSQKRIILPSKEPINWGKPEVNQLYLPRLVGKAWVSALFARRGAVNTIICRVFLRCSQFSGMLHLSPNKTCVFLLGLALFLETVSLIDTGDINKNWNNTCLVT